MSYCKAAPFDRWISKTNYLALLQAINQTFGPPGGALANEPVRVAVPQQYLVIRGIVDFTTADVAFLPFVSVSSQVEPLAEAPGNHVLRLLDGGGAVLLERSFQPTRYQSEGPPSTKGDFLVAVPANPAVKQVVVQRDNQVLAARTASPNPPEVQLEFPDGGENLAGERATIRWSGNDPDGDALSYELLYSNDGGVSWETLAVDWPARSYDVSLEHLTQTANGRIRVIASDGFNSGSDDSDGAFSVPNHAPRVRILAPSPDARFVGLQQVVFAGMAQDVEDGGALNLEWTSSLDGVLGNGDAVHRDTRNLSQGSHEIRLTATDSAGLKTTASVNIQVFREDLPALRASLAGNQIVLSWPQEATNFVLEATARLASPSWAVLTNAPDVIAERNVLTLPTANGTQFYRLRKSAP